MIRAFAIIFALLVSQVPALAQSPIAGFPPGAFGSRAALDAPPAGGACSEYTTWIARTSGTSGTEQTAYQNMICNYLVPNGVWCGTVVDAIYILATNNTTTANLNLCSSSFTLTPVNSPTFTADQGYTGNGSNMMLTTGLTCNGSGVLCDNQASASFMVYDLTNRTTNNNIIAVGDTNGLGIFDYCAPMAVNANYGTFGSSASAISVAETSAKMLLACTLNTTTVSLYKNGNTTAIASGSVVLAANSDSSVGILAVNNGGSAFLPTTDQISAVVIGRGLSATEMGHIADGINCYMITIGINIYGSTC